MFVNWRQTVYVLCVCGLATWFSFTVANAQEEVVVEDEVQENNIVAEDIESPTDGLDELNTLSEADSPEGVEVPQHITTPFSIELLDAYHNKESDVRKNGQYSHVGYLFTGLNDGTMPTLTIDGPGEVEFASEFAVETSGIFPHDYRDGDFTNGEVWWARVFTERIPGQFSTTYTLTARFGDHALQQSLEILPDYLYQTLDDRSYYSVPPGHQYPPDGQLEYVQGMDDNPIIYLYYTGPPHRRSSSWPKIIMHPTGKNAGGYTLSTATPIGSGKRNLFPEVDFSRHQVYEFTININQFASDVISHVEVYTGSRNYATYITDIVVVGSDVMGGPPEPPEPTCCSNVAFIHGFQASYLYDDDDQVWLPTTSLSNDLDQLHMDVAGNSVRDIQVGDAIARAFGGRYQGYQGIFDQFDNMVVVDEINDWQALNYDWRYSPLTIATAEFTNIDGQAYGLLDQLRDLAATSKTEQVTVVTHSYGGLVARMLYRELAKTGETDLIDQIIFTVPPFAGTPKALGGLLHGAGQDIGGGLVTRSGPSRELANNVPAAYVLGPSESYFGSDPNSIAIRFDQSDPLVAEYYGEYGDQIDSWQELQQFINDSDNRTDPSRTNNLAAAATVNSGLWQNASDEHQLFANQVFDDSIKATTIAGEGFLTTLGWEYHQGRKWDGRSVVDYVYPTLLKTLQGDETVVANSTTGVSDILYFDQREFFINEGVRATHAELFRADPINDCITSLIQATECQSDYIDTSLDAPDTIYYGIQIHSPITLIATDGSGNQAGITSSDEIITTIAGSYAERFAGSTYIYLPSLDDITFSYQYHNPNNLDYQSVQLRLVEISGGDTIVLAETDAFVVSSETAGIFTINDDQSEFVINEPDAGIMIPIDDHIIALAASGSGGGSVIGQQTIDGDDQSAVLGASTSDDNVLLSRRVLLVIAILRSDLADPIKQQLLAILLDRIEL